MKFKFIISFQLIKDMKNLFPLSLLKSFIHLKIYIHSLFLSQLNRPCSFIVSLWPLSLWFTIDPEITSIRSFPSASYLYSFFYLQAEVKWSEPWKFRSRRENPKSLLSQEEAFTPQGWASGQEGSEQTINFRNCKLSVLHIRRWLHF